MPIDIREQYLHRYNNTLPLLERNLKNYLNRVITYSRVDNITVRAKSIESFLKKADKEIDGERKYSDPMNQIQDQIGARIITFYQSDVEIICNLIDDYFGNIEKIKKSPEENSFGYESTHFILFLPEDVLTDDIDKEDCPRFFELQIATLFQHAWAEASHNLAYKPSTDLSFIQKRKISFTAAQAWGADTIFEELNNELSQAN